MTEEEMHKLVEEAPQRMDASVQRWLGDPEFHALLHRFSKRNATNIRAAIEAAEAALRVLRRSLAEEEGR